MPKFTESLTPITSGLQYSAVNLSNLGASDYTLVGIACDRSGSTSGFSDEMEKALKATVDACQRSPRADNLLVRVTRFDHRLDEIHGFRPLRDIHQDDYTGVLASGGATHLFDASVNAITAVTEQGRELIANDYAANGIVVVVTDGLDYTSTATIAEVKKAIDAAKSSECLESLVTILIGVNITDPNAKAALDKFAKQAGFTQFVALADADEKTLARLAAFVSKSISSQSQAIGTGGPSQAITF